MRISQGWMGQGRLAEGVASGAARRASVRISRGPLLCSPTGRENDTAEIELRFKDSL